MGFGTADSKFTRTRLLKKATLADCIRCEREVCDDGNRWIY